MVETAQEYFWGVELSKDQPTFTWTFEEEDEDNDYLLHTLFLKNAVIGSSAVKGERNLVQIETKNFDKKDLKQPLLSLTLGQSDMCNLDISFGNEVQATFRLVEGTGPVALCGQQLVEFPPDEMNSQDESALEDTMDSELTEEDESPKKSKKRKAAVAADKKSKVRPRKKGKMEESMSSADDSLDDEEDDDEDDEDEDDEEDMEEDEEDSSSEKGGKKGKKAAKDQKGKKGPKATKVSPKKAAKKTTKKGRK